MFKEGVSPISVFLLSSSPMSKQSDAEFSCALLEVLQDDLLQKNARGNALDLD